LYSPVLLGRAAATLDRLSDSRFTLGLALESSAAEHAAVGVAPGDHQCRIEQMLEVMARVWRDEIVEIETTREVVAPSTIALKPRARRIPIVLGGRGDADLERVARRGDGWLARGVPIVDIAERWSVVTRIAEAYARDVERLRLVVDAEVLIGDDHGWRNDFVGTVEAVREDIERAREAGADELILDLNGSASSVGHLLDLAAELTDGVEVTV